MSGKALFTVAVPTCNGSRTIREALGSILVQKHAAFDFLLVDDASEDQTVEIARELAGDRLVCVRNESRLGLARNWNRCVELSQTPWVAIVHQDDRLMPNHLEVHERMIGRDGGLGMTVSRATAIDEHGDALPAASGLRDSAVGSPKRFGPGEFLWELAVGNPVNCSAVVLNKEVHQLLGGFNPSWKYVVDWDYWVRLAREWAVMTTSETTVEYRWHPGSESHRLQNGMLDLAEQEWLLERLSQELRGESRMGKLPETAPWKLRLSRAYLNRVYTAIKGGKPALAKRAWRRARQLWPDIRWVAARDLRLSARIVQLNLGLVPPKRRKPSEAKAVDCGRAE